MAYNFTEKQIERMELMKKQWFNNTEIWRSFWVSITVINKILWTTHKKIFTFNWETWTIKELCKIFWKIENTIRARLHYWMTLEEAFTKPVKKRTWNKN